MRIYRKFWIFAIILVVVYIFLRLYLKEINDIGVKGLQLERKNTYLAASFSNYTDSSSRLKSELYNDADISEMVKCMFVLWLQRDEDIFHDRMKYFHALKDPEKRAAIEVKIKNLDPLGLRHLGALNIVLQDDYFFILGSNQKGELIRCYTTKYLVESKRVFKSYEELSLEFARVAISSFGIPLTEGKK